MLVQAWRACLLALCVAPLFAAVTWTHTVHTATAGDDGSYAASFPFVVTDAATQLHVVDRSCGCAAGDFDHADWSAGDNGTLTIAIRAKPGAHERTETLTVRMRSGTNETTTTLTITVPDARPVRWNRRVLSWRGADRSPQSLELTAGSAPSFAILATSSDDPALTIVVEEIEAGQKYRLVCTPGDNFSGRAKVSVTTNLPAGQGDMVQFFALRRQ
jgi:hypothetical protein